MKILLTALLLTMSQTSAASLPADCETELVMNAPTKKAASYLSALLERQLIGDAELTRLIDSIDQGGLENPVSEKQAAASSALLIHRRKIDGLLKNGELDRAQLRDWAWTAMKTKTRERAEREKTKDETQTPIEEMVFHEIVIDPFLPDHTVAVMRTAVTQQMWVEIMGENPAAFKEGPRTKEIEVQGKLVRLQPNNPVENITWYSAAVFANRLSEKHGLEPFYHFNFELFDPNTRAENGTLRPTDEMMLKLKGDEKSLFTMLPENQNHNAPTGYRLPTEQEMSFLQNRQQNGLFFHFAKQSELEPTVWHQSKSNKQTQPVASLLPWVIQGKEFFDLAGNVNEWIEDRTIDQSLIITPHRELLSKPQARRKMFGGAWDTEFSAMNTQSHISRMPEKGYPHVGLRLVRSVR